MCSVLNCCRKASVNLRCFSEAIIYTNIVGNMGESNDCINGILLKKNIYKEIPINFCLLTTPVKDTHSINKTSTIFKLESYIETWKLLLPNETKEKGHLDKRLCSLHYQISSLETKTEFLSEEIRKKQCH